MTEKTDVWRTVHLGTIGASNAAASLGKGRFKTRRQLWEQMHAVCVERETPPALRETDDLRRGNRFESLARDLMAEQLGVSIHAHDQNDFRFRAEYPFAHCLPDGWIGETPVEIKVPRPGTVAKCAVNGLIEEWWIGCQHTMAILNAARQYVGLLDPMSARVHIHEIKREEPFIEQIMRAEEAFYQSVLDSRPPDEDAAEESCELSADCLVLDSEEAMEAARAFLRLREIEIDAKDAKESARDKLVEMLAGRTEYQVPGVMRGYHRKSKDSIVIDKAKLKASHPDVYDDPKIWTPRKGSKRFTAYAEGS